MAGLKEKNAAQPGNLRKQGTDRQPDGCCGCLDLEINRAGQIYDIGALLDGKTFSRHCRGKSSDSLRELDTFLTPAEVLLGHNLLGHDMPALRALQPDLKGAGELGSELEIQVNGVLPGKLRSVHH